MTVDDLFARMTLSIPAVRDSQELANLRSRYETHFGPDLLPNLLQHASSPAAEQCIRQFTQIEADLSSASTKGLGRMTAQAFPRLGGVLRAEGMSTAAQATVSAAVEHTMHAGYLTAVSIAKNTARAITITDSSALWDRWLPVAYSPPEDLWEFVHNTASVWSFWELVLIDLGVPKAAKALTTKPKSAICSSLNGLATAGSMLAYAER